MDPNIQKIFYTADARRREIQNSPDFECISYLDQIVQITQKNSSNKVMAMPHNASTSSSLLDYQQIENLATTRQNQIINDPNHNPKCKATFD